jgi:hypothetical protein
MVDFNDETQDMRKKAQDSGWADKAESQVRERMEKNKNQEQGQQDDQGGQNYQQPDQQ